MKSLGGEIKSSSVDKTVINLDIRSDSRESTKFKKWSTTEVGRLIFCLWELHHRRQDVEEYEVAN